MKASPIQQERLLALQDLDTQIARTTRKLQQLPERKQAVELTQKRDALKPEFLDAQRAKEELELEISRVEDDLSMVNTRRQRDEQRLTGSASTKEVNALQDEIDTLRVHATRLEDQELEFMEQLEEANKRFETARVELSEAEDALSQMSGKIAAAEDETNREVSQLTEERENVAAEVTGELRKLYEDLRERTGIGAARLRGNVSEASNMAIAAGELSQMLATPADELVFCPQTGAILIREQAGS
jgi:predicted  nucleic acid-binding Zn-ribbon protein